MEICTAFPRAIGVCKVIQFQFIFSKASPYINGGVPSLRNANKFLTRARGNPSEPANMKTR